MFISNKYDRSSRKRSRKSSMKRSRKYKYTHLHKNTLRVNPNNNKKYGIQTRTKYRHKKRTYKGGVIEDKQYPIASLKTKFEYQTKYNKITQNAKRSIFRKSEETNLLNQLNPIPEEYPFTPYTPHEIDIYIQSKQIDKPHINQLKNAQANEEEKEKTNEEEKEKTKGKQIDSIIKIYQENATNKKNIDTIVELYATLYAKNENYNTMKELLKYKFDKLFDNSDTFTFDKTYGISEKYNESYLDIYNFKKIQDVLLYIYTNIGNTTKEDIHKNFNISSVNNNLNVKSFAKQLIDSKYKLLNKYSSNLQVKIAGEIQENATEISDKLNNICKFDKNPEQQNKILLPSLTSFNDTPQGLNEETQSQINKCLTNTTFEDVKYIHTLHQIMKSKKLFLAIYYIFKCETDRYLNSIKDKLDNLKLPLNTTAENEHDHLDKIFTPVETYVKQPIAKLKNTIKRIFRA